MDNNYTTRKEVSCGTISDDGNLVFSVMQWNILADMYADESSFPACPAKYRSFEYRKPLIINEILRNDADIVCLEEVDRMKDLSGPLEEKGYVPLFTQKRGRKDGTALLFKKSKFQLITKHDVVLSGNQWDLPPSEYPQIALIAQLEFLQRNPKEGNPRVTVAATHLKAMKEFSAIRNAQMDLLLKEVQRIEPSGAVIVCGDLNDTPTSAVYQFLSTGKAKAVPYGKSNKTKDIAHSLPLQSSYKGPQGEPITLVDVNFAYTLDYIFFSNKNLALAGILEMPSNPKPQPNSDYPSDHLSIMAKFQLK